MGRRLLPLATAVVPVAPTAGSQIQDPSDRMGTIGLRSDFPSAGIRKQERPRGEAGLADGRHRRTRLPRARRPGRANRRDLVRDRRDGLGGALGRQRICDRIGRTADPVRVELEDQTVVKTLVVAW
jgi:hypothetical protein